MDFIKSRSASLSMVVLVLFLVGFFQSSISYSISFGKLDNLLPAMNHGLMPALSFLIRGSLLLIILILWILNRKQQLFPAILVTNSIFTLGLLLNMMTLLDILRGIVYQKVQPLLMDVILLFSIWYWIIDPPGVDGKVRDNEPWDFLFPQRSQAFQIMRIGSPVTQITSTWPSRPVLHSARPIPCRSHSGPRCSCSCNRPSPLSH